jgi:GntR family phosphonate transport system transcriptional regulator
MLQTRAASPQEAEALGLREGARVHVYEGLSLSDEVPIALFRSVFPAERLPDMLDALRDTGSVTAAFAAHGIDDYTRAHTEITAKPADATLAAQLRLGPARRSCAAWASTWTRIGHRRWNTGAPGSPATG